MINIEKLYIYSKSLKCYFVSQCLKMANQDFLKYHPKNHLFLFSCHQSFWVSTTCQIVNILLKGKKYKKMGGETLNHYGECQAIISRGCLSIFFVFSCQCNESSRVSKAPLSLPLSPNLQHGDVIVFWSQKNEVMETACFPCIQGGRWEGARPLCSSLGSYDSLHSNPGPLLLPAHLFYDAGPLPNGPAARWDGPVFETVFNRSHMESEWWNIPRDRQQRLPESLHGIAVRFCSWSV